MDERTELEFRLRVAISAGEWLDLTRAPDKDVPAELLHTVLVEEAPSAQLRSVKLNGARIVGLLDLAAATLGCQLHLTRCEFSQAIALTEARAPTIRIQACTLTSLTAEQLETRGDLDLRASMITDGVRLLGAQIGGRLLFCGATLTGLDSPALSADGLRVDGSMFCRALDGRPFTANGEIRIPGAHVGELDFDGAELSNPGGRALDAERLRVEGNMFCRALDARPFTANGEIRLLGAHVGGLEFDGAELNNPGGRALNAERLRVEGNMFCRALDARPFTANGEIRLLGAHVGGLEFDGAELNNPGGQALQADGLRVEGNMFCRVLDARPFTANGEIRLPAAHVGGLLFDGAELSNPGGRALQADGLRVDRGLLCRVLDGRPFTANGEIRLLGAHVGWLDIDGAELSNPGGRALDAERLRVEGNMFCRALDARPFTANGEIRLLGAHVGGLEFDGAELNNPGGRALDAERLRVDGSMFCRGFHGRPFTANGEIRIAVAHIGVELDFNDARLTNEFGPAVNAGGLQVETGVSCGNGFSANGTVNLVGARTRFLLFPGAKLDAGKESGGGARVALALAAADVDMLGLNFADQPKGEVSLVMARMRVLAIPRPGGEQEWPLFQLDGCTYQRLVPDVAVKHRLAWLPRGRDAFRPQPYDQLVAAYRSAGHDAEARRVAIEKQRQRRQALPWSPWHWPTRAWSVIFGATVAHGYRLWQAGIWLLVLVAVGAVLFGEVFHADERPREDSDLVPAKSIEQVPPFQPVVYTVDLLVPVISLGQRTAWNPVSGVAQWTALALTLVGWVLTAAFVAGLAARRQ